MRISVIKYGSYHFMQAARLGSVAENYFLYFSMRGPFKHPQYMLKLIDKETITILRSESLLSLINDNVYDVFIYTEKQ